MPTPYPPALPTVAGTTITVDAFLNNPPRVQRTIEQLTLNRFIADRIFAAGPQATGGAVLYDQVTAGQFFTDRDVQGIEPGSEWPILNSGQIMPLVAGVTKWGGSAVITYEAARRDRRDLLRRELVRLRNTIIRKVDTVALAVLNAAPIYHQGASAHWAIGGTDIIADILTAQSTVDQADMGYEVDTVVLNPASALSVRKNAGIRAALPRERMGSAAAGGNIIGAKDLDGLLGIPNWYITNRQPATQVVVLAGQQVGGIADELPLYSRTVDEETIERYRVMSARVTVPYVTDPHAAVSIDGTA